MSAILNIQVTDFLSAMTTLDKGESKIEFAYNRQSFEYYLNENEPVFIPLLRESLMKDLVIPVSIFQKNKNQEFSLFGKGDLSIFKITFIQKEEQLKKTITIAPAQKQKSSNSKISSALLNSIKIVVTIAITYTEDGFNVNESFVSKRSNRHLSCDNVETYLKTSPVKPKTGNVEVGKKPHKSTTTDSKKQIDKNLNLMSQITQSNANIQKAMERLNSNKSGLSSSDNRAKAQVIPDRYKSLSVADQNDMSKKMNGEINKAQEKRMTQAVGATKIPSSIGKNTANGIGNMGKSINSSSLERERKNTNPKSEFSAPFSPIVNEGTYDMMNNSGMSSHSKELETRKSLDLEEVLDEKVDKLLETEMSEQPIIISKTKAKNKKYNKKEAIIKLEREKVDLEKKLENLNHLLEQEKRRKTELFETGESLIKVTDTDFDNEKATNIILKSGKPEVKDPKKQQTTLDRNDEVENEDGQGDSLLHDNEDKGIVENPFTETPKETKKAQIKKGEGNIYNPKDKRNSSAPSSPDRENILNKYNQEKKRLENLENDKLRLQKEKENDRKEKERKEKQEKEKERKEKEYERQKQEKERQEKELLDWKEKERQEKIRLENLQKQKDKKGKGSMIIKEPDREKILEEYQKNSRQPVSYNTEESLEKNEEYEQEEIENEDEELDDEIQRVKPKELGNLKDSDFKASPDKLKENKKSYLDINPNREKILQDIHDKKMMQSESYDYEENVDLIEHEEEVEEKDEVIPKGRDTAKQSSIMPKNQEVNKKSCVEIQPNKEKIQIDQDKTKQDEYKQKHTLDDKDNKGSKSNPSKKPQNNQERKTCFNPEPNRERILSEAKDCKNSEYEKENPSTMKKEKKSYIDETGDSLVVISPETIQTKKKSKVEDQYRSSNPDNQTINRSSQVNQNGQLSQKIPTQMNQTNPTKQSIANIRYSQTNYQQPEQSDEDKEEKDLISQSQTIDESEIERLNTIKKPTKDEDIENNSIIKKSKFSPSKQRTFSGNEKMLYDKKKLEEIERGKKSMLNPDTRDYYKTMQEVKKLDSPELKSIKKNKTMEVLDNFDKLSNDDEEDLLERYSNKEQTLENKPKPKENNLIDKKDLQQDNRGKKSVMNPDKMSLYDNLKNKTTLQTKQKLSGNSQSPVKNNSQRDIDENDELTNMASPNKKLKKVIESQLVPSPETLTYSMSNRKELKDINSQNKNDSQKNQIKNERNLLNKDELASNDRGKKSMFLNPTDNAHKILSKKANELKMPFDDEDVSIIKGDNNKEVKEDNLETISDLENNGATEANQPLENVQESNMSKTQQKEEEENSKEDDEINEEEENEANKKANLTNFNKRYTELFVEKKAQDKKKKLKKEENMKKNVKFESNSPKKKLNQQEKPIEEIENKQLVKKPSNISKVDPKVEEVENCYGSQSEEDSVLNRTCEYKSIEEFLKEFNKFFSESLILYLPVNSVEPLKSEVLKLLEKLFELQQLYYKDFGDIRDKNKVFRKLLECYSAKYTETNQEYLKLLHDKDITEVTRIFEDIHLREANAFKENTRLGNTDCDVLKQFFIVKANNNIRENELKKQLPDKKLLLKSLCNMYKNNYKLGKITTENLNKSEKILKKNGYEFKVSTNQSHLDIFEPNDSDKIIDEVKLIETKINEIVTLSYDKKKLNKNIKVQKVKDYLYDFGSMKFFASLDKHNNLRVRSLGGEFLSLEKFIDVYGKLEEGTLSEKKVKSKVEARELKEPANIYTYINDNTIRQETFQEDQFKIGKEKEATNLSSSEKDQKPAQVKNKKQLGNMNQLRSNEVLFNPNDLQHKTRVTSMSPNPRKK